MTSSWSASWPSESLLPLEAFKAAGQTPNTRENGLRLSHLSYERAEKIAKAWGITFEDIMTLSPKFWAMHNDPVAWHDGSSITVMTINLNLGVGTIGTYAAGRPELQKLCDDMLAFRAVGMFLLTEVGHGLDAVNLETTATLQADGTYVLHSPTRSSYKYIPPTVPVLGKPCYAIVWSQLIVGGENRGIRPFVVKLNDGYNMCKGITSKILPTRHGATPVNNSITRFNNVSIPAWSLLGPIGDKPSTHEDFLTGIWRISIGTLSLAALALPALRIAAHIAYKYSVRRHVGAPAVPIISFRTQQIPIFTAVAQTYVLQAYQNYSVKHFMDESTHWQEKHAIVTTFKAVTMTQAEDSQYELSERLGAQGLFDVNQISTQFSEMRGIVIAEGDALVLCIRLASELLLDRYTVPASLHPTCLLAQHEAGVFAEARALTKQYGHRSQQFADHVLPRSKELIEAIGHRMAYESALDEGVAKELLDLYEVHCIKKDAAWYVEAGVLARARIVEMEANAVAAAESQMEAFVDGMKVGPWAKAPILSQEKWDKFVDGLYTYREAPEERAAL